MLKYLVKCMADCIITVTDFKNLLHQNQTSDFSTKHDTKREGSTLLQGEISMVWIVQYLIFFCFRKWCWKATWRIKRGRTVTVGRSAFIDFILPYCFTFCVCVKHRLNVFLWTCMCLKSGSRFSKPTFDLTAHEMFYFLLVSLICPIIKWMNVQMLINLIQGLMGWVYYEFLSYKKGHNDYKRKTLDIAFIYFIWPGLLYTVIQDFNFL